MTNSSDGLTAGPVGIGNPLDKTQGHLVGVEELVRTHQFYFVADEASIVHCLLNPNNSGFVIRATDLRTNFRALRMSSPDVQFFIEPSSLNKHYSSVETPFIIDNEPNLFGQDTLHDVLDRQREVGSFCAMLPVGQIRLGDSDTLKKVLNEANNINRNDVVIPLIMDSGWLNDPTLVNQIIQVILRSHHLVALAFANSNNPLGSKRRILEYRRIFASTEGRSIAYRGDLSAVDAYAHGAASAVIGSLPSLRRATPPGSNGRAQKPTDRSPHMLLPNLLTFTRSSVLREQWFQEAPPIMCRCAVCNNQPIDRLYESMSDRNHGHAHNVVILQELFSRIATFDLPERRDAWSVEVANAIQSYSSVSGLVGRPIKSPAYLDYWLSSVVKP